MTLPHQEQFFTRGSVLYPLDLLGKVRNSLRNLGNSMDAGEPVAAPACVPLGSGHSRQNLIKGQY